MGLAPHERSDVLGQFVCHGRLPGRLADGRIPHGQLWSADDFNGHVRTLHYRLDSHHVCRQSGYDHFLFKQRTKTQTICSIAGMVCGGRVICGLAAGICSAAVPVYVGNVDDRIGSLRQLMTYYASSSAGEIATLDMRGTLGMFFSLGLSAGFLFTSLLVWLNWRVISGILAAQPILFLAAMYFVPESPYFLVKKGAKRGSVITDQVANHVHVLPRSG